MYLPFLSGDSGRSISPLTRRPLAGGADGALNFVVSKAAKIPFRSSGRTASRRLRAAAFLLASPMQKSWATVFASAAESLAASWPMAAAPQKNQPNQHPRCSHVDHFDFLTARAYHESNHAAYESASYPRATKPSCKVSPRPP